MKKSYLNKITTSIVAGGLLLSLVPDISWAAVALKNGQNVNGFIRANSPAFSFKNQAIKGTPTQSARGEDYTFIAQRGDVIQIGIATEEGSNLTPILVLFAPNGTQIAYTGTAKSLRYSATTAGQYKLLVLGRNNTRGRYTLSITGINQPGQTAQTVDQKKQFLQNEYGLRVLDNCPTSRSSLVVAYFVEFGQTSTYCANPNRALKAGEYTYNSVTNDLRPGAPTTQNSSNPTTQNANDDRRKNFLRDEYGVTVLDNCPASKTGLVVAYFTEYGQTSTYCARPNRALKAGEYTYDPSSNDLKAGAPVAQNSSTTNDQRKLILEQDYGLTVLNNCPAARSNLVAVTFTEADGQTYVYCANPNSRVPAGEYSYDTSTASLEPATKPQRCTVQVGGLCIVK